MFETLVVAAVLLAPRVLSTRVELHFESLCKQCQIHTAGFTDDVVHGGLELSAADAGVIANLELSVDYYGAIPPNGTCEQAAFATEHGSFPAI
jgi:hypothetical protein